MKVRRVWTCECGESMVLSPVDGNGKDAVWLNQVILKGEALQHSQPQGGAGFISCRLCSDRWPLSPICVEANRLRRVWTCSCESTKLLQTEQGDFLIQGAGHRMGHHGTHARCRECGDRYRYAPDVTWHHELVQHYSKRDKSRRKRAAARRRGE